MKAASISLFFFLVLAHPVVAQTGDTQKCLRLTAGGLAGAEADYQRVLEEIGAVPATPGVLRMSAPTACNPANSLWDWNMGSQGAGKLLRLSPVALSSTFNSAYPTDRNNGPMWAGRGLSTALSAGVVLSRGVFTAAFQPEVIWEQNSAFDLADTARTKRPPLAFPFGQIDLPQRFGYSSNSHVTPGQSFIRADLGALGVGVSTENLWWGPGRTQALILSNTASGFPHAFVGTNRPVDIRVGHLFVEGLWGLLDESKYFDTIPGNDRRLLVGMTLEYVPKWTPGLSLGIHRVYHFNNPGAVSVQNYFLPLFAAPLKTYLTTSTNPFGESDDNQLASLYARWVLPESGFETYFEWAKDDHSWDFWDIMGEPDHAQAYLLGVQKAFKSEHRYVSVNVELSHLESASGSIRSRRGEVHFYTHSVITQGHTNEGQALGAWIGPGSNSFTISADVYNKWGRTGGYIERIVHDNDAYYDNFAAVYEFNGHDAEVGTGARYSIIRGAFLFDGRVGIDVRRNRQFLGLDGSNFNFRKDYNLSGDLAITWRP